MTTIAIIGGGIAARSLLYVMAKKNIREKVLVFYSDSFAFPCSLHSTAIVAPRGVSTGHSPLGDILVEGFDRFARHISEDRPEGVVRVPQFTGAVTKLEAFKKRYPDGEKTNSAGPLSLKEEFYLAKEEAFLVRPRVYLDWLMKEAGALDLTLVNSFVTEVNDKKIRTVSGEEFNADKIIFTAGVQNSLWFSLIDQSKNSKSAQGCYLEFSKVSSWSDSFSLTLEGDNLIYDKEKGTLLLGSTTHENALELPPEKELFEIYERVQSRILDKLPEYSSAIIRTGLREKASKREAYILRNGPYAALGGLYKNGYRLSLHLAEKLLPMS